MADVLSPARTRVLLALIRVYQRDGRATVRGVADEAGVHLSTAYTHLCSLLEAGLLARVSKTGGTLRPLVLPVQVLDHG